MYGLIKAQKLYNSVKSVTNSTGSVSCKLDWILSPVEHHWYLNPVLTFTIYLYLPLLSFRHSFISLRTSPSITCIIFSTTTHTLRYYRGERGYRFVIQEKAFGNECCICLINLCFSRCSTVLSAIMDFKGFLLF